METGQVVSAILGALVLLSGGYFVKIRTAVKEIVDVLTQLQDVLHDAEGETETEKINDIKQLGTEAKEAFKALQALLVIKKT